MATRCGNLILQQIGIQTKLQNVANRVLLLFRRIRVDEVRTPKSLFLVGYQYNTGALQHTLSFQYFISKPDIDSSRRSYHMTGIRYVHACMHLQQASNIARIAQLNDCGHGIPQHLPNNNNFEHPEV